MPLLFSRVLDKAQSNKAETIYQMFTSYTTDTFMKAVPKIHMNIEPHASNEFMNKPQEILYLTFQRNIGQKQLLILCYFSVVSP